MIRQIWRERHITSAGESFTYSDADPNAPGHLGIHDCQVHDAEPMVLVPLADLRSVWVERPSQFGGVPYVMKHGVYMDANGYGTWKIVSGDWRLKRNGEEWDETGRESVGDIWDDFSEALAAARSAVDRAKKEAGG